MIYKHCCFNCKRLHQIIVNSGTFECMKFGKVIKTIDLEASEKQNTCSDFIIDDSFPDPFD